MKLVDQSELVSTTRIEWMSTLEPILGWTVNEGSEGPRVKSEMSENGESTIKGGWMEGGE